MDGAAAVRSSAGNNSGNNSGVGNLVQLAHRLEQTVDAVWLSFGEWLTPRQTTLLLALTKHEGVSQTALVGITGIDRSTLADIVRRMQRKGLIQRKRTKEDARAYAVKLTDQGQLAAKSMHGKMGRLDKLVASPLTLTEQASLAKLLEKLLAGHAELLSGQQSQSRAGATHAGGPSEGRDEGRDRVKRRS